MKDGNSSLISADRPVVRLWHPDDPKLYVEIQFETRQAANAAVEELNGTLKYASGLSSEKTPRPRSTPASSCSAQQGIPRGRTR